MHHLSADSLTPTISSVVTSATEATIEWESIALNSTLNVTGYDILVLHQAGDTTQGSPSITLTVGRHQFYQVVQGLVPETVYSFQVRVRVSVNVSQWSTPVFRSTLPTG